MKLVILLMMILVLDALIIHSNNSEEINQCINDTDWPEKPCLDTGSYSDSYLKKIWQSYYQMKGKEWMEMKKAEMETAIKDDTLKEWTEYGSSSHNGANYNVWYYYHLNGQAPDIVSYYNGSINRNNLIPIITYYYISSGAIVLLGSVVGLASIGGFFVYRKVLRKNNSKNSHV